MALRNETFASYLSNICVLLAIRLGILDPSSRRHRCSEYQRDVGTIYDTYIKAQLSIARLGTENGWLIAPFLLLLPHSRIVHVPMPQLMLAVVGNRGPGWPRARASSARSSTARGRPLNPPRAAGPCRREDGWGRRRGARSCRSYDRRLADSNRSLPGATRFDTEVEASFVDRPDTAQRREPRVSNRRARGSSCVAYPVVGERRQPLPEPGPGMKVSAHNVSHDESKEDEKDDPSDDVARLRDNCQWICRDSRR